MNYIELINNFWRLRRGKKITSVQADLYFCLINECNTRHWENPFEWSNGLIQATLGITEPTLGDARKKLQEIGLIDFQNGKRKEKSPVYTILNLNNLSKNRGKSMGETEEKQGDKGEPSYKPKKTKPKKTKHSFPGDKPPAKKEKKEKLMFWESFVKTWDDFYKTNKGASYNYLPQDFKNLEKIYDILKKRAAEEKMEFSEKNLIESFRFLLKKAWEKDDWLRNNFSVSNVLSQFNSIVNGKATSKNGKPATGANVDTRSMLSKIYSVPNQS